jgi:glucose uptake protein GlcU
VTARSKRLLTRSWVYIPAVASPVGGGMIKLGRGSTLAAVAVSLAPYAVCALMLTVFMIGYLAALARYLWAQPEQQKAMERLIMVSANAVVSILTLTVPPLPAQATSSDQTAID